MLIPLTRLHPNIPLPLYHTPGAAAFDIAAAEDSAIPARSAAKVGTGLVIATPANHALIIIARSSLYWKKGLIFPHGLGLIDQDFCGPDDEIKLPLWNPGDAPVMITAGERLAQGFFVPIVHAEWVEGPTTAPSRGGFGSTG